MVTGRVAIRENTQIISVRSWKRKNQSKRIKGSKRPRKRGSIKQRREHLRFNAKFFLSLWPINVWCQTDVTFNWKMKKTKHFKSQSIITCSLCLLVAVRLEGFTAQSPVNKRLNQIEPQKMKGKHEWGNEGAGVVSDQITISTDYWRGKRLIELFYHTESLRLSPHTQKANTITTLVGGWATYVEQKLLALRVAVLCTDGNVI